MSTSGSRWQLYTPEEAAPILRVSRATMYRLLRGRHPAPHRVISGRKMLSGEDIDAYLARSARGAR